LKRPLRQWQAVAVGTVSGGQTLLPGLVAEHNADLGALVGDRPGTQWTTGFLPEAQQLAVVQRETVLMQWTLDYAIRNDGGIQGVTSMGTIRLYQEMVGLALQQQQMQGIDLELTRVTIVQVDKLLEGKESHNPVLLRMQLAFIDGSRQLPPVT
jgi:hypothetical protein